MSSCIRALVLLACVLIGVDALVVLEVDLVAVLLHRQALGVLLSLLLIVSIIILRLCVDPAVVLRGRFALLVLRSHFVKFELTVYLIEISKLFNLNAKQSYLL